LVWNSVKGEVKVSWGSQGELGEERVASKMLRGIVSLFAGK
jgi:hypothetical protein